MKISRSLAAVIVLIVASSVLAVAHAQAAQTSYTLSLNYFTVQLTYPSQVNPGDLVSVNMQANAKNNLNSATLTVQVFYVDGNTLRQVASTTASNNAYVNSGGSLSKQITFTVPQDAPRTSLSALVTESVQNTYSSYSEYYYPTYYNYSSPSCYYYPDYYDYYSGYCSYSYTYYPYSYSYYPYYYYGYPSYSYTTSTDSGVAPLSYIKAQTPEYSSLQSQYQAAQQQLNQSQAQNQQLQHQLQNSESTIAQRDATIASLNQQLSSGQNVNTSLEAAVVGLAIVAAVFAAFAAHSGRKNKRQQAVPPVQHSKID